MRSALYAFVFFLAVIWAVSGQCNIHPQFWCDDIAIAKKCGVLRQCEMWQLSSVNDAPLVNFTLYYESLCPDCKNFISNMLGPSYKKIHSIMNLELVPYGNAEERKGDHGWKFFCQHGKLECQGNLIETCAINLVKNITVYFPFILCMESSSSDPETAAKTCAKQHPVPLEDILKCSTSDQGNQMEHEMAVKTNALRPKQEYVPWVTLNGVHTNKIQKTAENDLTKLICDNYKGHPKPDACQ